MSSYDFRYIGADSLPSRLSEFDLQQYFQLSRADILALTERFRIDRRAGAAILLLFLKVAGRPLDRFSVIPRSLLRYVGTSLGMSAPTIATMRVIYQRRPTLYEHQAWAKEYLGLKEIAQPASDELENYLRAHANEVVSIDELVTAARRWLYERQILIPGDRTIRDLARNCYEAVEKEIHTTIITAVPRSQLNKCSDAVYAFYGGSALTMLEWLKTPPKRHSPSTLSDTLAKIAFLKTLGTHEWAFDSIPLEKQRGYAQQIQARRPAKSKLLKETRHDIELVFFLRITLLELNAIHESPDHNWTLESMAELAHLSRSAFAQRFTLIMGVPPLEYLTGWRMGLARSLLAQGKSIKVVAQQVGYQNAASFSRAFQRATNLSPSVWKQEQIQ